MEVSIVMAKNIVFVLHGIGEYQDGWMERESSAVPTLRKAASDYPFFDGKSLDSFIDFVPVLYDDVYERILRHWSDLGEGLKNSIPVMPPLADKVASALQGAGDDKWWLKTGADVLLYWGFKLFQQRIVLRVIAQIANKVADTITTDGGTPGYHILAHSMGTAVAHDALHHLGTESWLSALQNAPMDDADGDIARAQRAQLLDTIDLLRQDFGVSSPFDPSLFNFESVTMISNVSALIHGVEGPYTSIVQPGSATTHGAFTRQYLNVNHDFDPVSLVGNFEMPAGWEMRGGVNVKLNHLVDVQDPLAIHDAAHYIAHPNLHLRLLQSYVDPYSATDTDVAKVAAYDAAHGPSAISASVKSKLKQIKQGKIGPLKEVIGQIKDIKKSIPL